jgi:hypothetical protein
MRAAAQEVLWGPRAVVLVIAAVLCMLSAIAMAVALVAVPALRSKLTVVVAVVASEVRSLWPQVHAWRALCTVGSLCVA